MSHERRFGRETPFLTTTAAARLMGTSVSALTKRIQRGGFPEPLAYEGRSRLWSYTQVAPMLDAAARAGLRRRALLRLCGEGDLFEDFWLRSLGTSLGPAFLIDGRHLDDSSCRAALERAFDSLVDPCSEWSEVGVSVETVGYLEILFHGEPWGLVAWALAPGGELLLLPHGGPWYSFGSKPWGATL